MTSAVKSFLVLLLALPVLIYLGSELGNDDYVLPLSITGVMLIGLLVALFFRGTRIESLLVAFLLGGYIVGSRGFAQLSVVPPLFVGEVALSSILVVLLIRYVLTRDFVFPSHPLTWAVGMYLAVAFARFCFDVRSYGLDAARDAATVYYAIFFFIAYQLGRRKAESDLIDGALKWSFVLLAIVATISVVEPAWLEVVQIRGTPLLIQKGDLTATYSGIAVFFLLLRPETVRPNLLRWGITGVLLSCIGLLLSRAALVAMMCAYVIPWVARIRTFRLYPPLLTGLAVVALLALSLTPVAGPAAPVVDQFLSIADFSGTYHYQTEMGDQKSADNNFRRVLWTSFYDQTVQSDEWFLGKGFGYDFLPRFEAEYHLGHWEGLRSAHNYYVTIFGRLGVVGSGLLLAITLLLGRSGLQAAVAFRRGELEDVRVLFYWCAAWILLVSGTFGVVMEGPMGAIPFWTFMGLALGADPRIKSRSDRAKVVEQLVPVSPTWKEPLPVPAGVGR